MVKEWTLRYYFIAFLDVLGQSRKLLSLSRLPRTENEQKEDLRLLRDTAGYIIRLRDGFKSYFENCNNPTGKLDFLPPDKRAIADRVRRTEAIITSFADTITIAVPLGNEDDHCLSINSIYSALYGICGIYIAALAEHKPFRGGVEVGIGVPLTEHEIYGGALVKAYMLENSIAKYPRIVVGNSLFDYLDEVQNFVSNSVYASCAKKWAGDCKTLIVNDYDKLKILDVIGEGAQSILGGIDISLVEKAYAFVVQAHNSYRNSGDLKLCARYGSLRSYFESKLHLWNIDAVKT